ncbi:helix-turn-helix transcriptional regulator [Streptomyces gobiensis]|uniref:helix-turn-helix transcriptional regulator n=1 Tax=Streptomyces gobiensis TaxID=2875706 RepID=UPI001E3A5AD9|nr:DNA-binding response regulator [Streptomyces gobiensis]UGY94185.1 DNA-binding response regulator [Streptomyces gobiensis]
MPSDSHHMTAPVGDADAGVDGIENALLLASDIVEQTMSLNHERRELRASGGWVDETAVVESLTKLLQQARYTVNMAVSSEGAECFTSTVPALLNFLAVKGDRIVVRLLSGPTLIQGEGLDPLFNATGCEVRVAGEDVRDVLIVDGWTALVRSDQPGEGALLIKDLATVRAFDLLLAGAWAGSRKIADYRRLSELLHQEAWREVMERLRSGETDERAAEALNMSVRTYRRRVADIMRELGVTSRFQAGLRAVELGLLPEVPPIG